MSGEVRDLIVVGSGPAGYTAATYAARAALAPTVIEGSVTVGGALMTTTDVENFPGFDQGIEGPALMMRMRAQAERFGAQLLAEDAITFDLSGPVKTVRTEIGVHRARAVVLAMGAENRRLALPSEAELTGRGVSTCATCDGAFFRDEEVAVVGGGDAALEEALFLTRFARRVVVIHRRGAFRASALLQARLRAHPGVEVIWDCVVTGLLGASRLEGVVIVDRRTGGERRLAVSGLFVAIGHTPRSTLVRDQVDTDQDGYVLAHHPTTHTNVPGVFACGDLVDRRYRQAVTAAGSGCAAALDAERYLATTTVVHDKEATCAK